MKSKQVVITIGEITRSLFVGAVPGQNATSGENGFIACGFSAEDGKPTDPNKGKRLAEILFETEDEALKQGEIIVKSTAKAQYAKAKKDAADRQRASKRKR